MLNNELLTIGKFSALTGVGIHSLRYYDEIGILKPEYVDPVSNYRYYSFKQLSLMPAIEICKDAGINLNRFGSFLADGVVDYDKLLDESRKSVELMIRDCRTKQNEMDRAENLLNIRNAIRNRQDIVVSLDSIPVWTIPCGSGSRSSISTDKLIDLSSDARRHGVQIIPSVHGIMKVKEAGGAEDEAYDFSCISLDPDSDHHDLAVRVIPEGNYLFRPIDKCSLDAAAGSFRSDPAAYNSGLIMAITFICDEPEEPLCCGAARLLQ